MLTRNNSIARTLDRLQPRIRSKSHKVTRFELARHVAADCVNPWHPERFGVFKVRTFDNRIVISKKSLTVIYQFSDYVVTCYTISPEFTARDTFYSLAGESINLHIVLPEVLALIAKNIP